MTATSVRNHFDNVCRAVARRVSSFGGTFVHCLRIVNRRLVLAYRSICRQRKRTQKKLRKLMRYLRICFLKSCRDVTRRLASGRDRLDAFSQQVSKRIQRVLRHLAYVRGSIAYRLSRQEYKPKRMKLRVLEGVHSGAQREVSVGDAILIGSDKDCDITLSDSGVAAHHCILTVSDGKVSARDIDARVRIERRKHRLSRTSRSDTWWRVALADDAIVGLGPTGRSEWGLAANAPTRARTHVRRALTGVAGVAGIVLVAVAMSVSTNAYRAETAPTSRIYPDDVRSLVSELKLEEIEIDAGADGELRLHGVVPTAALLDRLRQELGKQEIDVQLDVRIGADIARDVREVLRLSGITAKSRYKGKGEVEVSGTFHDETLLESAVSSRAMLEIGRLESVVAVYVGGKKVPEGKNIVAVVRGADPYVVTADGSRYYVGATLPTGGTLQEINDEEILITTGTQTERLDIKTLQSSSTTSNLQDRA